MPARRKPTALLIASGAFAKNPARARDRENEPVPEGPLGDPPAAWVEGAANNQRFVEYLKNWREIVAQAAFGVLTSSDRWAVEKACTLKYKIDRAEAGYGKATSGDYNTLNKMLGQFGMTPADRSKVSGGKKTEEAAGAWAELAGQRRKRA
ncbi:MAG TPA: hypothetical protein VKB47_08745 [Terracidiphilus sp.]|nr:hypothetical protein [Terracidiphilus sp.]